MSLTPEENEILCRVGRGTPMGELMRRYWVPACLSEELPEPDCDPIRLRLLGEDLIAFRDSDGRVGVMQERCPHRGASLFFGRNEEGGIRCLYHGWKIAADGKILDTPCEPVESMIKFHVRANAYPTYERAQVVWAYMGPPDRQPALPDYWWMSLDDSSLVVGKIDYACSYLQGVEGTTDSAHNNALHAGFEYMHWTEDQIQALVAKGYPLVRIPRDQKNEMVDTPYGFRYGVTRPDPSDPGRQVISMTPVIIPWSVYLDYSPHMFVPSDDEHTWLFDVRTRGGRPFDRERELAARGERVGIDLGSDHRKLRTLEMNYLQDRKAMRERKESWSYSGMPWGKPIQDMSVTESMGRIYDRQGEHLGVHDAMVVRLREVLLAAIRRFEETGETPAADPSIDWSKIRGGTAVVPAGTPWSAVEYPDPALAAAGVR
ncbi:MAG TPA: Rieske 2Fe-2S domain-containing protein [Chloroflexota bacterium]|nr:Rieske 2Fe-2S domain-containing protein [Chloroflexota bacterium]